MFYRIGLNFTKIMREAYMYKKGNFYAQNV